MSVGMRLLAILEENPSYGLSLKNEFEARTGGIWALNVGQVYTTLGRLQRDGLVEVDSSEATESQKVYALTDRGRRQLEDWFIQPAADRPDHADRVLGRRLHAGAKGGRTGGHRPNVGHYAVPDVCDPGLLILAGVELKVSSGPQCRHHEQARADNHLGQAQA
jgi:DNA-binding PadR family transcriptional regulator